MFGAIIVVAAISILAVIIKRKFGLKEKPPIFRVQLVNDKETEADEAPKKIDYKDSYLAKKQLLSKNERIFHKILKIGLPGHEIFANVRLADIIKVHPKYHGNKRTWLFRNIAQYHIDFLVCDEENNIITAIELDDPSHDNEDSERRDAKKDECLDAVGIKLIRFRVENMPKHTEIRNMVYGTQ